MIVHSKKSNKFIDYVPPPLGTYVKHGYTWYIREDFRTYDERKTNFDPDYRWDKYFIDEQNYKDFEVNENDVVLDIGGHIGEYCIRISPQVKKVIAFEPDDDNFYIMNLNVEENHVQNILLHEQAISDKTGPSFLFCNPGINQARNTLTNLKGRTALQIDCISMNDVLELYPEITKIKMDCEGAEYNIIRSVKDWKNVQSMYIAYHKEYIKDADKKLKEVIEILSKSFSEVVCKPGLDKEVRYERSIIVKGRI